MNAETWEKIDDLIDANQSKTIKQLFAEDPGRASRYSIEAAGWFLDYSKNRIDDKMMKALLKLAEEANLKAESIKAEGTVAAAEISKETKQAVADIHAAAYNNGQELYDFLQYLDTLVASVNGETVLVIDINKPPFNVLVQYADQLTYEGEEILIEDLERILEQMPEEDRQSVVEGITALLASYTTGG